MNTDLKSRLEALYLGLPEGAIASIDESKQVLHIDCGNSANPYELYAVISQRLCHPQIAQYNQIIFWAKGKQFGGFSPAMLRMLGNAIGDAIAPSSNQDNCSRCSAYCEIKSSGNSSEGRQYRR